MKKTAYLLLMLNYALAFGQGHKTTNAPEFGLLIQQETSYDFSQRNLQKSEWQLEPEVSWKLGNNVKFYGQLRLYSELTDRLDPGKPNLNNYSRFSRPIAIGDRTLLELREMYADIKFGKTYWRLGKQQIVLGQTEGIKVLDVLNPMTFREFILDDFEDSRIPLWSIKGDIPIGKFNLQTYWIPDMTYHHFPNAGGMYSLNQSPSDQAVIPQVYMIDANKPNHMIRDSDIGAKLSTFWNGWDLTLSYLYQYDNMPVMTGAVDINEMKLTLQPKYKRIHVVGNTFGNTFGSFGIRGEVGFIPNKFFTNPHFSNTNGSFETSQIISALGIDYFGISETLITLQWFGDWVQNNKVEEGKIRTRMTNAFSLMTTRFFMNQRLEGRIFGIYSLDEQNGVVDLKLSYLMQDNFKVWFGGNAFFGANQGLIGQFSNRNRISIGTELGFQWK